MASPRFGIGIENEASELPCTFPPSKGMSLKLCNESMISTDHFKGNQMQLCPVN